MLGGVYETQDGVSGGRSHVSCWASAPVSYAPDWLRTDGKVWGAEPVSHNVERSMPRIGSCHKYLHCKKTYRGFLYMVSGLNLQFSQNDERGEKMNLRIILV